MFLKSMVVLGMSSLVSAQVLAGSWGYSGKDGPEKWAQLSPDYATCGSGRNQSPVDLNRVVDAPLEPIQFHYDTVAEEVVNNGHTVQVNVRPGSYIVVNGKRFELKQFHFHAPSENRIEGRTFPMEGHWVHADHDGNLAVVAVMFTGDGNGAKLRDIWRALPMQTGETTTLSAANLPGLSTFIPEHKDYYRFNGSLTTPPCSEGVVWLVMKEPVPASSEQLSKFRQALGGHDNNRPVQPLNARLIVE